MFYIIDPARDTGLDHVFHRSRRVWQWFYDGSNKPWKTESGALRALEKLKKRYPLEFGMCYVGNPFLNKETT
jgi:anaerobic selenocysteine-containing dehydrogenase